MNPRLALLLDPILLLDIIDSAKLGRRLALPAFKHFPKLEVLVAACRCDCRSVRTQARMQDACLVGLRDIGHFAESRVGPDGELVIWDTVRGEDLLGVRIEDEGRDLRAGLERVEASRGASVPEVNRTI